MHHNFFAHSSVSGHLGCFPVMTFVHSPAGNTGVQVSFWIMVFLECMPSSGIAGSQGSFTPGFLRYLHMVLHSGCINLHCHQWASLIAQLVKNLPAMQETLVGFLGRESPLEKGQATHSSILGLPFSWEGICLQCGRPGFDPWVGISPGEKGKTTDSSILAWRIPWTVQYMGLQKSWTQLSDFHFLLYPVKYLIELRRLYILVIFAVLMIRHSVFHH